MSPARAGLYVVTGPGGVGKGTVVAALRRAMPEIIVSVSATTRPPRPGEVDGVHYHFLDAAAFEALIAGEGFLEWAEFNGHRYGTPWESVGEALVAQRPVVLEIDVQGARQVRERFADAVLIFLAPPDDAALLERLRRRGTDDDEAIARRMDIARWELAQATQFDHVIVNDDLDRTVTEIGRILQDQA